MCALNVNSGVTVVLLNKKITLKINNNTLLNLGEVNNFYELNNKFLNKTKKTKSLIISATDLKTTTPSMNLNVVQKNRKAYFVDKAYTKFGATPKLKWFFYKFKYQGKGLKIKKSTKSATVDFNLGSSHISKLYFNNKQTFIYRTKKNTYTAVLHRPSYFFNANLSKTIRPYNIYTKRGVRVSRQTMHRRFGKVSQLAPKKR